MRGEGGVDGDGRVVGVPNYIILFTRVRILGCKSITAPQDHKRLVMQVTEWLTASLCQCSREVSNMS